MDLPTSPSKPSSLFTQKRFLWLIIVLISLQALLLGYWFSAQNKLLDRLLTARKTDPAVQEQNLPLHPTVWSASLEFDPTLNQASLVEPPTLSQVDFALPTISQKPAVPEGSWVFEVVVETKKGEILYRSYRTMTIFPSAKNPKIWDFGVIIPYTKDSIIRLFDLSGRQIFIKEI